MLPKLYLLPLMGLATGIQAISGTIQTDDDSIDCDSELHISNLADVAIIQEGYASTKGDWVYPRGDLCEFRFIVGDIEAERDGSQKFDSGTVHGEDTSGICILLQKKWDAGVFLCRSSIGGYPNLEVSNEDILTVTYEMTQSLPRKYGKEIAGQFFVKEGWNIIMRGV
ncbi:uncharacterized protein N7459_002951 [Penicillium hispanicum]|uniref:uncharacterized protein n=1 Tax=Penicillium hispanicum TaxID=1080232 RepID=UPI00254097DA|nr:uncharacterized protein N7459_002951 [Penicillium hispanicum]KAJ5587186.1 hypothetical protein N7459_002951 [Penicillium hispanicum]